MKNPTKIILVGCIAIVLGSCSKTEDTSIPSKGSFELVQAGNSARLEAGASAQTEIFELGDVRASKTFNFVLANNGGQTIENIKIMSDNANFEMSPATITKLDPKTKAGLTPIISLAVIHGSAINGSAISTLLPKGDVSSQITITGTTTTESGTKEEVSMFAKFNASSKVMDLAIIHDNKNIKMFPANGGMGTNLGGLGFMRSYNVNSDDFKIKNTGNVAFTINYGTENNGTFTSTVVVKPSEESSFSLAGVPQTGFIFEIDGTNTVASDNRLQLGNNKKAYLNVWNVSSIAVPGFNNVVYE